MSKIYHSMFFNVNDTFDGVEKATAQEALARAGR
jgi:hypothetical protein